MAGPKVKVKRGLVVIYFGNGKGKTTAALGLALRAAGAGKKVEIIQFIKGGWKTSEENAIEAIKNLALKKYGVGFVGGPRDNNPRKKHVKAALLGLKAAKKAVEDKSTDIVVLDEINWAVKECLIGLDKILGLIKKLPAKKTLVLTGAPRIKELIEFSDIATEMKKVKHPYNMGVAAKKGIDY